jgi:hypothetical protein
MDVFEFYGEIKPIKETDKFKPISKVEYKSGWCNVTTNFNVVSSFNRVMCQAKGGMWSDPKKNSVKTFSKSTTDENGKTTKGEPITIAWDKRNDPSEIDRVAGFRRYVVDIGNKKMRYALQHIVESGTITEEQKAETGCDTVEAAKEALEKSNNKRKIFIAESDFAEYCAKLVQSDKIAGSKFKITGDYEVQYSADKQKFYTNYHVRRIELMGNDVEEKLTLKTEFYFGADAWDDSSYAENEKVLVNGFVKYYDSSVKDYGFKPMTIVVTGTEKKVNALKKKFACDDGAIKLINLDLDVVDGAERKEIRLEDLDPEVQEDIDMGILDFETVKREMGGGIAGPRVSELRFAGLGSTKGAQETVYTEEDMHPAVVKVEEEDEEDVDLFSDDDDL